jgi:hypothetical protein
MDVRPFHISAQPYLGELRIWTTDIAGRPPVIDPTIALRAEVAELSLRLAIVETRLARPWWGARAWAWLREHLPWR